MSLQKAKPANTIYQVIPPRSKRTAAYTEDEIAHAPIETFVTVSVPHWLLKAIYDRLKGAEQPRVVFNEDQGAMFMEAYRERGAVIKEVLQELEPYV